MSDAMQNIQSKLVVVHDFEETAEVIKAVVQSLVEINPSINVDCVNKAIEQEGIRRKSAKIE